MLSPRLNDGEHWSYIVKPGRSLTLFTPQAEYSVRHYVSHSVLWHDRHPRSPLMRSDYSYFYDEHGNLMFHRGTLDTLNDQIELTDVWVIPPWMDAQGLFGMHMSDVRDEKVEVPALGNNVCHGDALDRLTG